MGRAVVIHPDLGIGGAERLIIDASKALQDSGHQVKIYTGYHDKNRCFDETKDGTLETFTVGQWIPRNVFGKFHALMAYIKMIYIAIYLFIFSKHDLVLCDQVSACVPILRLDFRNKPKIIFYCHFPDQLLIQATSLIRSIYRYPINRFEEWSTGLAHVILVNSEFTSSVVKRTFKSLRRRSITVLHPCVNVDYFKQQKPILASCRQEIRDCKKLSKDNFIFLSLNRFEAKKDIALAIKAFGEFMREFEQAGDGDAMAAHLIVAGGYDTRLQESVLYYDLLKKLASDLQLDSHLTFIESPDDNEKVQLFELCHAVVYTPKEEHFGIVPLEAMAKCKPVIASNTGGPLETLEHGKTGLLCEHLQCSFADSMLALYLDRERAAAMGQAGQRRVQEHFSYGTFRDNLNKICYPSS